MKYDLETLSNGLRLLTIPMPFFKSATILILVGVGSRYEEKEINGISHFLEHMAFKGTEKRPTAMAIATTIDGIGGEFNAFTSKDHTGYYIKAATKHVPLIFDVLSDMLLHSKFDEAEIEKEKGVIIEEINMYEDTPIRKIGDLYENLLYGDTKLGRDIAGRKEVIRAVKREDFTGYIDRFYGPKNTVVVVAGGVESELRIKNKELRINRLTEEYLGGWKEKRVEVAEKAKESQESPGLLVKHKDTQQAHICLGVHAYNLADPRRYALSVMTNILGGSMSSRLFSEVREKRGLAYYIRANTEKYTDVGNFVIQAGVDVSRIDLAIQVILEELNKFKGTGATEEEFDRSKENIKGKLVLELEDSRNVAGEMGGSLLLEGKVRTPDDIIKGIEKVEIEDLKKVAEDIFLEKTLNLAVIGPYKEEGRFNKLLKL